MAVEPLPFIAEDDYPAFRAMIPKLPVTYAHWLELQKDEARQLNLIGLRPMLVRIYPSAFAQFLRQGNWSGTMILLHYCAMETATRERTAADA